MTERELKVMLEQAERRGIEKGIQLMQGKMLLACKSGIPIEIEGRAYFIKSDIQNLHDIFESLEKGRCDGKGSKTNNKEDNSRNRCGKYSGNITDILHVD